MRTITCALGALVGVLSVGCGGGSSGGGGGAGASTAPGAAPATTTTSSNASPAPVVSTLVVDATLVPSGPSDATWYFRTDDPTTPDNEAALDIARAIAATPNGLDEAFVQAHLAAGGGLAIFVGGLNHERDGPTRRSGWITSFAPHVYQTLGLPALQVDYLDRAAGTGLPPLDLALYNASFHEGVVRTLGLVEKALSAGAGEVRLYGHSKGGDIVQEVTWLRRHEPRLTYAMAVGVPLWSAANLDAQPGTGRGGLVHRGTRGGRDWGGKLVVFNRRSDRMSHGQFLPPHDLPGPGHDYSRVLLEPAFRSLLERAVFQTAPGWEDPSAGQTYDY